MGRPRTDIPTRILHAARARFLSDGVDGASLRTIAKDAGTSIGMVFYYYPTKDSLFLAVVEELYAKLLADLEGALGAPDVPLRDRLKVAFGRLGHATAEELDVIRLIVREALVSSPRFGELLARFRRGHIGLLLGALAEGAARGEVDPAVPLPLALIATFALGGLPQVARRIAGDEVPFAALPNTDALAEAAVDVLFRGIGPRATPGKPARTPAAAITKRKPRPKR
jgi:AcrR family transcriptional regulator